ncbi:U3 snoRNP-associated protein Utp11 [Cordyceps fumosorosea ARSEF 2679]|uniref:U3 small nucleolar RNA-associated protein 11 n=1 Tax=Cordyceps fumosorosea (strain ARSEF 2679) TaxID=1081104 RepID=A0A167WJU7_CORFA|nr:U3 snoRNP-associated protein Utp11 [Cordyceps fumosorosea ARSEF 2679]OAA63883.1 U3 snoRNP-associated protein Utp11 [Cordyceps fumosorosea ARSEF 2679]
MSSMRNAVDRRVHRERAQPLERRRLGLLEKHKDYSKRAQDYNKKKAQIKALRAKAAERNEDEFYFGMMSRKGPGNRVKDGKSWSGTVQGDRGNKILDIDTARLLKTQDMGYIRTMKQMVTKEVARLEEQIVMTRGIDRLNEDADDEDEFDGFDSNDDDEPARKKSKPKAARKILFFDDQEAQEDAMEEHLEIEEQETDKGNGSTVDEKTNEQESEREKSLRRLKRQLENARKKFTVLTDAEQALEEQRAKMAKTATSGGRTRRGKKLMVRTRKR